MLSKCVEAMRAAAIVNPNAGGGSAARRWREAGWSFECRFTKARGHATALARELCAAGYDTIIAAGGDGTVNEVVNGVIGAGSAVRVGMMPLATGGDFARTLGITGPAHALEIIAAGRARPVDAVRARSSAGERYFVNTASIGLGAEVARTVSGKKGLLRGRARYLAAAVKHLAGGSSFDVRLSLDCDSPIECRLTTAALGNGRFQGGGMLLCPLAELDDGLLDLTVVEDVKLSEVARHVSLLYSGKIHTHPKVRHWRARFLRAESDHEAPFELDGEPAGTLPVEVEVIPRAWCVLAP